MKGKRAFEQPILKVEKRPSANKRKRSVKREDKKGKNPFKKVQQGINTTLDFRVIEQEFSPRVGLRSDSTKKIFSIVSLKNMTDKDKPAAE